MAAVIIQLLTSYVLGEKTVLSMKVFTFHVTHFFGVKHHQWNKLLDQTPPRTIQKYFRQRVVALELSRAEAAILEASDLQMDVHYEGTPEESLASTGWMSEWTNEIVFRACTAVLGAVHKTSCETVSPHLFQFDSSRSLGHCLCRVTCLQVEIPVQTGQTILDSRVPLPQLSPTEVAQGDTK